MADSENKTSDTSRKPILLVLTYARTYKKALIVTVISMILLVGAQLIVPWIITTLISAVTTQSYSAKTMNLIVQLTVVVLFVYIFRAGLEFVRSYMAHVAGWGVVADLRKHTYEHIQQLSLHFYEDKQTGQLMSRIVNDTDLFEQLIAHAIPDLLVNILTLIGVSLVLFMINWKLALLSILPIPLVIFSLRIYAKYVRPAFRERQKELGILNGILNDSISGIRDIQAFTREDKQLEEVGIGIERYRKSLLAALRMMAIFQPFVEFTSSLGNLIVIFFGGQLAFKGLLPVADLVAFFLYLNIFYQPILNLGNAWENIQGALAGADRVGDLLEQEPEVQESPNAFPIPEGTQDNIVFDDVSFYYNANEPVLEHIKLEIPAHKVVALVGPTGVGKSTLVSLIPRFYDICEGRITLNGQDIRDYTIESLRQHISIVLQDVFLFHGTVRENILFGRPDASDAEVFAAAKIANAHNFISTLEDGYDTMIGERGVRLSGGQKQRLSIARAVLKNAPILILDEATSSVDTETEMLIQEALNRLMFGRTTIIIAHRLSTIQDADKIVVLEGKGIKEMGTHEELLKLNGLYKKLYTVQKQLNPAIEPAKLGMN